MFRFLSKARHINIYPFHALHDFRLPIRKTIRIETHPSTSFLILQSPIFCVPTIKGGARHETTKISLRPIVRSDPAHHHSGSQIAVGVSKTDYGVALPIGGVFVLFTNNLKTFYHICGIYC